MEQSLLLSCLHAGGGWGALDHESRARSRCVRLRWLTRERRVPQLALSLAGWSLAEGAELQRRHQTLTALGNWRESRRVDHRITEW